MSQIPSHQSSIATAGDHWFNDLLETARRQIFVFAVVFFSGLVLTFLVIAFAPRKYQSQAKLLVKVGRESVSLDPTVTTTGDTTNIHRTRENEVKTALEVMKSRQLVEEVVRSVGEKAILDGVIAGDQPTSSGLIGSVVKSTLSMAGGLFSTLDPVPEEEQAIRTMRKALEIVSAKDASVVEIRYQAKSPELANLVAKTWVQKCIDSHTRINSTPGSLQFFEDQKTELLQKLETSRRRLQQLKTAGDIVTVEGAQESLLSQITLVQGDLIQARAKHAASKARLNAISEIRQATSEKVVTEEATSNDNETVERMRDRLYALEIEERQLAAKLTGTHPALVVIREQLAEARKVFVDQKGGRSEVTEGINPLHVAMSEQWADERANVVSHQAEVEANEEVIEELRERLKLLNGQESELANVEREVEVLELHFREQFGKFEQARLAVALEASRISNLSVVQPASLEFRPVTPNKPLCAVLGFIGSLLASLGIVTIRESQIAATLPVRVATPNAVSRQPEEFDGPSPSNRDVKTDLDAEMFFYKTS